MSKYDCLRIYQSPYAQKRLGKNNDGGYVICQMDGQYDTFISGGIGKDISFELDLLKQYPNLVCQAYDGSIHELPKDQLVLTPHEDQWIPVRNYSNEWIQIGDSVKPFGSLSGQNLDFPRSGCDKACSSHGKYIGVMCPHFKLVDNQQTLTWNEATRKYKNLPLIDDVLNHRRIVFHKSYLGKTNDFQTTNLRGYFSYYSNIFMKIDIEGGETDLFKTFTESDLRRIKQLVIEFHNPKNLMIPNKLVKTHWLVHLHPNNNGGIYINKDGIKVPTVYECTFIRKKQGETLTFNNLPLPQSIDQPNDPNKPDIILKDYPYVN